jgi:hypothetical protein
VRRPRLTYANVMSTIAVFIALGGTSYAVARNSIGTAQLKNNAVTSAKIKNRTVATRDLTPGARGSQRGPRGPQGPPGSTADLQPEPWNPQAVSGGWANYPAGGLETGAFRKDKQGEVHLRGTVAQRSGPPVRATTIAVLPEGYRPGRTQIFETASQGDGPAQVSIQPNGEIIWVAGLASDGNFTTLNAITFYTD